MNKLEVISNYLEARLEYAKDKNDQKGIAHWSKELEECKKLIEEGKENNVTHDYSKTK